MPHTVTGLWEYKNMVLEMLYTQELLVKRLLFA